LQGLLVSKKTDSMAGVMKVSRCVHSSSRCYKNKSIPRGKGFLKSATSAGAMTAFAKKTI